MSGSSISRLEPFAGILAMNLSLASVFAGPSGMSSISLINLAMRAFCFDFRSMSALICLMSFIGHPENSSMNSSFALAHMAGSLNLGTFSRASVIFSFLFTRFLSSLVSWNSLNSFMTSMMYRNSSTMWSTPATSLKVSPEKLPSLSLSATLPPIIFALLFPNSSIMSTLASFLGMS